MDLVDIPTQLQRALWYSGRSWKSFTLSALLAVVVAGVAFDLAYGFFFTRIYNVEHAGYGRAYWLAMSAIAVAIPLVFSAAYILISLVRGRRFAADRFGVAIASFEVASVHVDSMATSDKLQALDEAGQQFFAAAQQLVDDEEWASNFDFRPLPAYTRVRSKADARRKFDSLGATLLIWGQLVQEDKLMMSLRFTGVELDMAMTGPVSTFFAANSLKLWSLLAAVNTLKKAGRLQEAEKYLDLAVTPARDIDRGGGLEKLVQRCRDELRGPVTQPAAVPVASVAS